MRILLLSLLICATSAAAQPAPSIDCDAVKNSMAPVELAFHGGDGAKTIVQSHRDASGGYVVWSRHTPLVTSPNPPVYVTKATYVGGFIASAELFTTWSGKYSHTVSRYAFDGLPKGFDRRSDATYQMYSLVTHGDDSIEEKANTISYKYKSEEAITVGACVLQAIHGETDTTTDTGRTLHAYQVYFPELRIFAVANDAEPIVDSVSTDFSEIKPVN